MFAYNIVVVVVIITIVRWLSVFVMTTASEKSFRNYSGNPNGQFLYCASSVCLFFTVFPFFFYCWIMSSKYWWTFLSGSLPFHVISNYIAIVYLILANKNIWSDLNQIWYTCTGQGWRWSGNLGRDQPRGGFGRLRFFVGQNRRYFANFSTADFHPICQWHVNPCLLEMYREEFSTTFRLGYIICPQKPQNWMESNRYLTLTVYSPGDALQRDKLCSLHVVVQEPESFLMTLTDLSQAILYMLLWYIFLEIGGSANIKWMNEWALF